MKSLRTSPLRSLATGFVCLALVPSWVAAQECGFGLRGFGGVKTGTVFKDVGPFQDNVEDVVVQPDGKIVVVSELNHRIGVTRFLPNGQLDESFGPDGNGTSRLGSIGFVPREGLSLAMYPDGRILIAGSDHGRDGLQFLVVCLTANGFPNANFGGGDGYVKTDFGESEHARSISVASDGSFLVGGIQLDMGILRSDWDVVMARYHGRGGFDTRLAGSGKKKVSLGEDESGGFVQALPFGRSMVAMQNIRERKFFLHRFHIDGASDHTLGNKGHIHFDFRYDENHIVDFVAVENGASWILTPKAVYAFEPNGQFKRSFGDHPEGGSVRVNLSGGRQNSPVSFARLENGKIVIAGTATSGVNDFAVTCLRDNGQPDPTFGGGDGYVRHSVAAGFAFEDNAKSFAVAPDGKFVVAGTMLRGGSLETAVMRLLPDGSLDQDCPEEPDPEVPSEIPGGGRAGKAAFLRGDANTNGVVDLTDAVYTLEYLFSATEEPPCMDALDANDDAVVDLSDATRSLGFLFLGHAAPPAPFENCGRSTRTDSAGCVRYDSCTFRGPAKDLPSGISR